MSVKVADVIHGFMRQYCRFLSKDLIAALDGKLGRSEKIIYEILKVYFIITNCKYTPEIKQTAVDAMEKIVNNYLSEGDATTYNKMFEKLCCNELDGKITVASIMFNHINQNFKYFMESGTIYKNHFKQQPYFKQSMIEFNNALSHLYNVYCNDVEFSQNASRANTHLHRGTLDFYKTMIRDKKNGLTVDQKDNLINLRLEETGTIGTNVQCDKSTKKDLPTKYKEYAENIGYM